MTILGMAQAQAAFARIAVAGVKAADVGKAQISEDIADDMRTSVAVDTGETRDSIEVTDEGVSAGGASIFLEYGTSKMSAQPFARPAADTVDGSQAEQEMKATVIAGAFI